MTDFFLLHEKFADASKQGSGLGGVVTPERRMAYQDMENRAGCLALEIQPFIGQAGRVLICLKPGIDFITAMVATLKAGAAYVPLHRGDPHARIAAMSALPGADLIITDNDLSPWLSQETDLPVTTLGALAPGAATPKQPGSPVRPREPGDHAYIIHTSGSTGAPKAMGISHKALANLISAFDKFCPLGTGDKCALWSALHFDVSVYEIWSALLSGATLFIPEDKTRFSPEGFLDWLACNRITSAYIPPFMLESMADGQYDFALKRVLTGVEPVPEPLLCRIKQKLPGLTLINGYGPAETAVCATLYPVPDIPSTQGRTPIGKPVENMEIHLVNARGHKVPKGEKGEIIIQGIQVSDGYINAPDRSVRVFERIGSVHRYRTGDMGMELEDGNLVFLDRKDVQIKFKGVRIEPGEVEGLLRKHPDISQAALVLKPLGSGGPGLVAYVTPRASGFPDTDDVMVYLKGVLPRAMMPAALICLATLPVTAQGKTDRKALVRRNDPELTAPWAALQGEPPPALGERETRIARIWEQVLGIPPRPGNENFILLGGDSIAAARIMARINQEYQTDLSLNLLFDWPDFRGFAARVLEKISLEKIALEPELCTSSEPPDVLPATPIPLMPDQELIWLFETLYPGTAVYHIPLVFEVSGDLDPGYLETAVNQAVQALPALGFSFSMTDDKVVQKWAAHRIRISLSELENQEPNRVLSLDDPEIRKWLDREICHPFTLARGPLVRAALLRMEPYRHILCFTIHHLVCDGWSAGLFIQSLNQAYDCPGEHQPPAPSAVSMPDLSGYRAHVLYKKKRLDRQWTKAKTFFIQYLADLPTPPALPENTFKAATCPVCLEAPLYTKLQAMARQHNTTCFALLLAVFQIALALRTTREDQITGIAYAGRDRLESESVTGCLMNTLIVRNKVTLQTSFTRFLAQMKKNLDTVFHYRDIPFRFLQTLCQEQGGPGEIFDALFLMQTMPLDPLSLGNLEIRRHPETTHQANTGLTLELYPTGSGASGWLKYRTGQYSEQEARDLVRTFTAGAEQILNRPDEALGTLAPNIWDPAPDGALAREGLDAILSTPGFPLSSMQYGMLMETLRAPQGAGCYVEQVVFDMEEEINPDRFTAAWNRIVRGHEFLRLGFRWQGREYPEQYLADPEPVQMVYNDWSGLEEAETKDYLEMFFKADRRLGFSLDRPPAFRLALFKTGQARFTCVWSFHHCIGDGRSMAFVLKHLFQIYRNPGLNPEPSPSFRHYIAWLHTRKQTRAKQFWQHYLTGFTEPMIFHFRMDDSPTSESRRQDHVMALTTGDHDLALPPGTCQRIMTLCRENSLTINTFLMGAWAVLLSHYTGKTDVLFGATVSTRHFDPAHKNSTGLYINTLPVRIQVKPDQPLISYVSGIRAQWKEIRAHDYLPLTDIHALSPIQGSSPLSEIYFSYDYQTLDEAMAPVKQNVSCGRVRLLERTPAAIFLAASGTDNLRLSIEYDRRKFNARTTKQILDHFSVFLNSCTRNPDAPLKALPVLTEKETTLIRGQLNTCQKHLPPASCFHQLFEIEASINPGAPAVTGGDSSYTYGRLNDLANQVAHLLLAQGAGPETKVLILMDQTPDLIAAIIGVLKSGACYVPLETSAPGDRLQFILSDCAPDFVITTRDHQHKTGTRPVKKLMMDQDRERISQQKTTNPGQNISPANLAYIIYTSGTTGRPKGVMIEHQALAAFTKTAAQTYDIQAADRVLQFASISFDASAEEIFPTLYAGATLVIKPRDLIQTPKDFFAYCQTLALSVIDLPTAYWHMIADEIHTLDLPPCLRLVIIGGETAHPKKLRAWQAAVKNKVRLLNTYGPTETTVVATWEDLSAISLETDCVPIGIPLASVNISILNHFGQPVPPGVAGELFIGGPQVARGYLNLGPETRNAFIRLDAAGTGTRFFKTGDLVKMLPSGQILFLGRRDRQVKIRGYRVEPGEIEQVLGTCELIRDCALVLARTPGQEIRMTAFVVPEPETLFDKMELKTWLRSRLPEYMIPGAFIPVNSLPYTTSGKVDYALLEDSLSFGASGPVSRLPGTAASPPAQTREKEGDRFQAGLRDIWEDLLDTRELGPEDNFFDVGGSSLTAIRLITAIEKRFSISLPVLAIFKFPVLKDLARQLAEKDNATHFSSISLIHPGEGRAPIFFVAGAGIKEYTNAYRQANLEGHPFYTVTVFAHKQSRAGEIIPMDAWEIARKTVGEILQASPGGPYIIVGYCRYCLVAYEIASQLNAIGKKVSLLVFLDEFWKEKGISSFLGHHIRGIRRFGLGSILKKILPKTREKLYMYSLALDRFKERFYTRLGRPVPDATQYRLMEAAFWKAYGSYIPLPYPGDALVLDTTGWQEKFNPNLRKYVTGKVEKRDIPATHKDWFKPPQIAALIQAVESWENREV